MSAPERAQPQNGEPGARRFFSHEQIMRVIGGLMLAMFLAALDQTIVAIALYSIATDLSGEALMPWIISGYLVVATVATPIYGKLSDVYGRWPLLSAAIALYLVASLASALAQSMPQLLAFRLLQGLGGGGLIVLVQTIIGDIVPRQERGRYQAFLSGVFALAAIAGPVIGGLLAQYLHWRAIFLFNLPLGIAAWLITRRGLRSLPRNNRDKPIDYAGAALLGLSLASIMIALMRVGQGFGLLDPVTVGLVALGLVAATGLWWQEQRAADPVLPPELFRNKTVMLCCAVLGINFLVMYGSIVMVPLAMQTLGEASAGRMAVLMLPFTLGVPLGSYISGKSMQTAARERTLLSLGSASAAVGSLLLALGYYEPGPLLLLSLFIIGNGVGLCIPASIVAVQAAVRPPMIGIATATSGMFRTLGGSLGIALMSAALFSQLISVDAKDVAATTSHGPRQVDQLIAVAPELLSNGFQWAFIIAAIAASFAWLLSRLLPQTQLLTSPATGDKS
ncbi:MAG: MFS transporter [Burkholderiaceae bacterium]